MTRADFGGDFMSTLINRPWQQTAASFQRSDGRVFLTREASDEARLPVKPYFSFPHLSRFIPTDAAERGGRTSVAPDILPILSIRHRTQVRPTIIEFVAVDVITLDSIPTGNAEYRAVQANVSAVRATTPFGKRAVGNPLRGKGPSVSAYPRQRRVNGINDSVSADTAVTSMQGDAGDIIREHCDLLNRGVMPRGVSASPGLLCDQLYQSATSI